MKIRYCVPGNAVSPEMDRNAGNGRKRGGGAVIARTVHTGETAAPTTSLL